MGGLYFKSGKDACISFKLWDIGQWVLQILLEKILTESIKREANLKWRTLKLLLKNFHFWEFFNLGRPPMRIRPPEKYLYFPTTFHSPFERAFEPLSCFFSSAPSSPRPSKVVHFLSYLHSSAPSSPRLIYIRARLRALVLSPFERAFEPSSYLHFESAFEPSTIKDSAFPIFLLSAPSSPHFLRASIYWIMRLRALSCLKKNPRIFSLGR